MATRVLVANAEKSYHNQLIEILQRSSYLVVAEQNEAKGALQAALQIDPDVIIIDDNLPGGSLSLARDIYDHHIAPVLIATSYSEEDMMEIAKAAGVFGMILKPIHETGILPAIETAINTFNNVKTLEREIKKLKHEIEQRKLLERAKGLLMDKKGFSEGEAFRYLQKASMDKCIPITKVAKNVIAKLQVR
ncbi:response regulator receiver and ANTAR domain protein [Desulfotomaculum arcticum]|uniref:Stage 0 sporulation protein A homolog n=1 Tax=Desulfotruncus arcticus DSM 17038 TaxID=1121424 RepID=A0A1I2N6P8_9FIRM|nr:ANTAR domain-containing protein [Desulfotruncus arcticus]SFF98519.1 response regulator receiver and ANTAR domain protein [Desulfotomaculum arcticum] [Desulfotruncus arcticus DSM 17038]